MAGRKAKKAYMSDETFAELIESFEQAVAYERGARNGYCVTCVEVPRHQQSSDRNKSTREKESTKRER